MYCFVKVVIKIKTAINIAEYSVLDPKQILKGHSECKSDKQFMKTLVDKLGGSVKKNNEILNNLWRKQMLC